MKRVILVRTRGPRNAGLAARAVANFGPAELVFVTPKTGGLQNHADYREMSHGVHKPSDGYPVVESLDQVLEDCTHTIGFTARFREHREMVEWPKIASGASELCNDPAELVGLVFGDEKYGLSEAETSRLAELAWIPTSDVHTSINLGMSVGIALSNLFGGGREMTRTRKGRPLRGDEREFLRLHMQDVLGKATGSGPARRDLVASIDRLISRAPLETRDARAWHRLLRQLGSRNGPADYGLPPPRRTRGS